MRMSKGRSSRPPSAPQPALDALRADPAGNTLRRAAWLEELDRRLRPRLPPLVAAHARLANVDRDRLVFVVDAPVWQARVRLSAVEVIEAARSLGLKVTAVVAKVEIRPPLQSQPSPSARPMSAAAQQALATAVALLREAPSAPAAPRRPARRPPTK